jgi:nucleoside-diphosphate-sugar epimerase
MVKKILITGANGFIGRNLVEFYQNQFEILTLSKKDNLQDILDKEPNYIINCAASIYDIQTMFDTNVRLVNDLIEYVKRTNTPMIQIGSSAEYGKKSYPTRETDILNPVSFYAGTKAAATMICQSAAIEFDLPIIIARPYSVYGRYEKSYRLFPNLYNAFKHNQNMELSDGYHDFIYIKDFIRGIDKVLMNAYNNKGDIVNLGSGRQTSNVEVYNIFVEIFGFEPKNITFKKGLSKTFESKIWVCDTTYAKDKYNFKTEYSLREGILDLIKTNEGNNI